MGKMTDEKIKACYDVGKRFYANEISREDGVIELVDNYQMPKSSAEMYIQFFRYAMNGERHVPSINKTCLKYYLENVLNEYGAEQLKIFLQGLRQHIEYQKSKGKPFPSFCKLYNEYSGKVELTHRF